LRFELFANAMERLHALLCGRFDRHRIDLRTAIGFEQARRIGTIGLVAPDIGSHVACRQQAHGVALSNKSSCPIVRAAARFHHHTHGKMIFQHPAKRAA